MEDEYLCFPPLTTAGPNAVLVHGGRAAFPKLQGTAVYAGGSVSTFEFAPGAVLRSFTYSGSSLETAPRFVYGPAWRATWSFVTTPPSRRQR